MSELTELSPERRLALAEREALEARHMVIELAKLLLDKGVLGRFDGANLLEAARGRAKADIEARDYGREYAPHD